jgi:hypothetical protein
LFIEANSSTASNTTIETYEGGCMKKIIVTMMIGGILSAATVTPALANEWGPAHLKGGILNPLWPVVAVLSIPAAVVKTVADATVPEPVVVVSPPAHAAPPVYYTPREYIAPRAYHYAPRAYHYPERYHRSHHHDGW